MPSVPPCPLLTADLPGIGGRIKVEPEDFEVDELPSYEPSGSGDHLYLWVEKRDVGPEFFARTIARNVRKRCRRAKTQVSSAWNQRRIGATASPSM